MHRFLATSLSLLLLWVQTNVAFAQAQPLAAPSKSYAETLASIDDFVKLLEGIQGELDRSQFQIDALIESLNFEAEEIVSFMQERIRFEQYSGLLRGAKGTLLSRAGNSLDQAVLLARLLKDAGYDARIFSSQLSTADAQLLLKEMAVSQSPEPPIGNTEKIKALLLRFAEENGIPIESVSALDFSNVAGNLEPRIELLERVRLHSGWLVDHLEASGLPLSSKLADHSLVEEARHYFAVEYRDGPGVDWKVVHPALSPNVVFKESPNPLEYFSEEIPRNLQHRFRFEALISQRAGEKLTDKLILPAWERPVANLTGTTLTFTTTSANLTAATQSLELDIQNVANDVFFPQFYGETGALSFDLRGNVVPAAEADSMYAGVFETISQQANRAGAAIAGLGSKKQEKHLTELALLKVKYTLIAPGGIEREFERTIYDESKLTGSGEAAYIQQLKSLTAVYSIDVRGSTVCSAFVVDQFLENLKGLETQLKMKAAARFGKSDEFENLKGKAENLSIAWHYHGLQHLLFASFFRSADGFIGYYKAPAVSVHHHSMPLDYRYKEAYDLVSLPIRTINLETLDIAPEQTLKAGVWATLSEGSMLSDAGSAGLGIEEIFRSREEKNLRLETVLPGEKATKLQELELAEDVKRLVARDLESGYAVVLAHNGMNSSIENTAWWKIDPVTGESVGILANGEGSKFLEYLIGLNVGKMVAIAVAWLVIGIHVAVWCAALKSVQPGNMTPDDISWCEEFGQAIAAGAVALYALLTGGATAIVAAIGAIGKALDL